MGLRFGRGSHQMFTSPRIPETRLHPYGKSQARPGRKMGHISASGHSSQEALQRAIQAKRILVRQRDNEQQAVAIASSGFGASKLSRYGFRMTASIFFTVTAEAWRCWLHHTPSNGLFAEM